VPRPRRSYERWRWIEWLLAACATLVFGSLILSGQGNGSGATGAVIVLIPALIGYWIISYFINLSERQCPNCGERARKTERHCNSCGEPL